MIEESDGSTARESGFYRGSEQVVKETRESGFYRGSEQVVKETKTVGKKIIIVIA